MLIIIYIAAGIILLGLCVFVHELGHLLGGKLVGIKAKTFSIGYGKGILKKKIGDTTYQIAPIPFGGYCQFYGEDPSEERTGQSFEFLSAHPWRRIVTVGMGPLFNLLFGILIFFAMNLIGYTKDTNRVYIPDRLQHGSEASPAYQAGIRTGDWIERIGDRTIRSFSDIQTALFFNEGERVTIAVCRDGKRLAFAVAPRRGRSGRHEIGVMPYGTRILVLETVEDGAARAAGMREMDEILSVDGKTFTSESEFTSYINARANVPINVVYRRGGKLYPVTLIPRVHDVIAFNAAQPDGQVETIQIMKSKNLQKYLDKGSIVINGRSMHTYEELVKSVSDHPGKEITLAIEGEKYTGTASIKKIGMIGIIHAMAPDQILVRYGVGQAAVQALIEPWEFIVLNLKGIGMLVSGKLNVRENLSGPIRIAKIAGDVAYYKGIPDFIILMAKISIILMVMNLLPIPVVDGSHLVFFTIEWIRRKPLSQKVMERIQTVGIVILIMLGAFVIINDISMLPIIQRLFQ